MAARASVDVRLDERASAVVWAFCKDEGMGLGEALSFIVNDWAALKLAALEAAAPALYAVCDEPAGFNSRWAGCQEGVKGD